MFIGKRLSRRRFFTFSVLSLVIYCLVFISITPNIIHVNSGLTRPIATLDPDLSSFNDAKNSPVSFPFQRFSRGNISQTSGNINALDIVTQRPSFTRSGGYLIRKSRQINQLRENETFSEIIGGLNTIFKVLNAHACQHLDTSPPFLFI